MLQVIEFPKSSYFHDVIEIWILFKNFIKCFFSNTIYNCMLFCPTFTTSLLYTTVPEIILDFEEKTDVTKIASTLVVKKSFVILPIVNINLP